MYLSSHHHSLCVSLDLAECVVHYVLVASCVQLRSWAVVLIFGMLAGTRRVLPGQLNPVVDYPPAVGLAAYMISMKLWPLLLDRWWLHGIVVWSIPPIVGVFSDDSLLCLTTRG